MQNLRRIRQKSEDGMNMKLVTDWIVFENGRELHRFHGRLMRNQSLVSSLDTSFA